MQEAYPCPGCGTKIRRGDPCYCSGPGVAGQAARAQAMHDIRNERTRQLRLYGTEYEAFDARFMEVLIEEVGEVAEARQRDAVHDEYMELSQVAAVCLRRMESIRVAAGGAQ